MLRLVLSVSLVLLFTAEIYSNSVPTRLVLFKPGERVELEFINATKIIRYVYKSQQQHVYRVCNGKNKKTCGFWENMKNKKKVAPPTTYNKKKGLLIIQKSRLADEGQYRTPDFDTINLSAMPGDKVQIEFYKPTPTKISRDVYNAKNVMQTHVFRICNGKNKKTCGFWENTKTKKKVGPSTTYNKNKGLLIIPKVRAADAGSYYSTSEDIVTLTIMQF